MKIAAETLEVICVVTGFKLFDQECRECQYRSRDGNPLASGYYVVHWTDDIDDPQFDERANFFGPFRLFQDAEDMMERMRFPTQHWLRDATAAIPDPARQRTSYDSGYWRRRTP